MNKIVIYGFGRIGKGVTDHICKFTNYTISCIFERNDNMIKELNGVYENIPILSVSEIDSYDFSDKDIFICLASSIESECVENLLSNKKYKNIYKFSEGMEMICSEVTPSIACLKCIMLESCHRYKKICLDRLDCKSEKISEIDSLSIMVTGKCTLNCRGCVACVDRIDKHTLAGDMKCDVLKKYMSVLFSRIDYINHVELAGGEALMCKELPEIIDYLCSLNNIGYVKLLTNATIKFSDKLINVLERNRHKVMVCLDNYGTKLPLKIQSVVNYNMQFFHNNENIAYSVIDNQKGTWYDLGSFNYRSDQKGIENNKTCFFRRCLVLSVDGIVSYCTRNIVAMEYGFIPDFKSDYYNINSDPTAKLDEILSLAYLHGCAYCEGSNPERIIESGCQSEK